MGAGAGVARVGQERQGQAMGADAGAGPLQGGIVADVVLVAWVLTTWLGGRSGEGLQELAPAVGAARVDEQPIHPVAGGVVA